MNLWSLYPWGLLKELLTCPFIIGLPWLTISLYIVVIYRIRTLEDHRLGIAVFLILSLLSSGIMLLSMGPNIGNILPPILLMMTALMPLILAIQYWVKREIINAKLWSLIAIVGFLHYLSWSTYLLMLAKS